MMTCEAVEAPAISAPPADVAAAYSAHIGQIVATMQQEGGGIHNLVVVDRAMWDQLVARRAAGDLVAASVLVLADGALDARAANRPDAIRQCCACGGVLQDGAFQLAVALPDCPAPDTGLTIPICRACGATPAEAKAAAWPILSAIFNGIRVFAPMPDVVGHA